MRSLLLQWFCLGVVMCAGTSPARGQMAAARLGVEEYTPVVNDLPLLSRENAESFIALEGRAEVRVPPTQVRIVLAVTSEGPTAQECKRLIQQSITAVKTRWQQCKIAPENIVEDFIAVLPVHAWKIEKRGDGQAGVEQRSGFRLQINLHVAVPNDATAPATLEAAFEQGITDIIAVDYWSPDLDDARARARNLALKAARGKADALLATLFENLPPLINVQEQTTVRYPETLYDRFENAYQEELTPAWKSEMPMIRVYRPKNTYYRGLHSDSDVLPEGLPMRPEISVVSTVRLYYESPAARRAGS